MVPYDITDHTQRDEQESVTKDDAVENLRFHKRQGTKKKKTAELASPSTVDATSYPKIGKVIGLPSCESAFTEGKFFSSAENDGRLSPNRSLTLRVTPKFPPKVPSDSVLYTILWARPRIEECRHCRSDTRCPTASRSYLRCRACKPAERPFVASVHASA